MLLFKENHQPTPQLCLVSHKGQYLDLCCFYHYISSISQLPLSNGAQMTLYADDLLLIKPIKVANDYILLQQDIPTITNHIKELHLTQMQQYILGSRKRQPLLPPQEISISSCQIERVQSYCYLGVIVNQRISWYEHIQHLCLKERKLIGILYRQFYTPHPSYCVSDMHSTTFRVYGIHATRMKALKCKTLRGIHMQVSHAH